MEDVVPPPERRHAAPLVKYFLPTFWEVATPLGELAMFFKCDVLAVVHW